MNRTFPEQSWEGEGGAEEEEEDRGGGQGGHPGPGEGGVGQDGQEQQYDTEEQHDMQTRRQDIGHKTWNRTRQCTRRQTLPDSARLCQSLAEENW